MCDATSLLALVGAVSAGREQFNTKPATAKPPSRETSPSSPAQPRASTGGYQNTLLTGAGGVATEAIGTNTLLGQ